MRTERNPNANKFKLLEGYRDLGWQLHSGNCKEIKECHEKGHKRREFDNSLYRYRCTDVVYICDECKIIWHIDMSD